MSITLRTKAVIAMATIGFTGALIAGPAAASPSDRKSGCLVYEAPMGSTKTPLAKLCRSWEPNSNGSFNGLYYVAEIYVPGTTAWAHGDGRPRPFNQTPYEMNYYENIYDLRLQACYNQTTCSGII